VTHRIAGGAGNDGREVPILDATHHVVDPVSPGYLLLADTLLESRQQ
jgi:hypothetical protein